MSVWQQNAMQLVRPLEMSLVLKSTHVRAERYLGVILGDNAQSSFVIALEYRMLLPINCQQHPNLILLNLMSLDIDIIYTNDIFRLQSSDTTFGALLYLA